MAAATGELWGEQTVQVGARGFDALLRWARGLDGERVWAPLPDRTVAARIGPPVFYDPEGRRRDG